MRFNAYRRRLGRWSAIHKPQKSANRQIAGSYSKQKCGSDGENDGRECHERQQTVLKLRCCPSKLSLSSIVQPGGCIHNMLFTLACPLASVHWPKVTLRNIWWCRGSARLLL